MNESSTSSFLKKFNWKIIIVLFAAVALAFGLGWATYARPPLPEAIEALENDDFVVITDTPWLTFTPTSSTFNTGFIFYPGGRIDPQGYATLMRTIAEEGYLVVVPEMPLNMAVFHPNIADEIIASFPDIHQWVIGGHSVGGTMAAQYTNSHRDVIDGLAIWASYPADNADLAQFDQPVLSVYGSLDPRVNQSSVSERQHLLPDDTVYVQIEGGDHHQFGSYEINPKDSHATISREAQQEQILQATLGLLESVEDSN